MKDLIPLSQKYFDIIALFSREPFVKLITKELEYYTDGSNLIGFICLDLIDIITLLGFYQEINLCNTEQ